MDSPERFVTEFELCDSRELTGDLGISPGHFDGYHGTDSSPATYAATWTTNPAMVASWTRSDVDALQAGVKREDGNFASRVTQLYVIVDLADAVSSTTYAYNDVATGMNELLSTSGVETASFAYTGNGELATKTAGGSTWTYAYNEMGLLKEVKKDGVPKATYAYDGLGRRVKATENTVTTCFVYGLGHDPLWTKTGTTETRHVYANGMRIARQVVGGATYYYHADALGSTWRMTDASKGLVFSTAYEPFGRPWGTTDSFFAKTERYTFLGERNDTVTGQTYLRARQYDPSTGRFTSLDPVLGSLGMPQTLNRYPYVVNNPARYTDPTGACIWDLCIVEAILIGALVGAIIGGAAYAITTPQQQWTWGGFGAAVGLGALGGAVAGATFGAGAWAMGGIAGGAWALGGIGYGGMFLIGGASGFAAYHAEVGVVWAATGQNTWSWEGAAGSFALGGALAMGGKWLGPKIANWWRNRFPTDPYRFSGRGVVWDDVSRPTQGRVLRSPIGGDAVELQYHGGHPLRPGEIYNPAHHGPHYTVGVRGLNFANPNQVTWYRFMPGEPIPSWLIAILGG